MGPAPLPSLPSLPSLPVHRTTLPHHLVAPRPSWGAAHAASPLPASPPSATAPPRPPARRRVLLLAPAMLLATLLRPTTALAEVVGLPLPYCVPGLTAERCRGTFWESGQLYRKRDSVPPTPPDAREYAQLKAGLAALGEELRRQQRAAASEVGAAAYEARREVRKAGAQLCRALEEEERYEAELRLNALIAALGDVDSAALRASQAKGVPAEFTQLGILLDNAIRRLDEFLKSLPDVPTAVE
ncbi:hypothetical protein AB1Y20_022561 [Prymnesium parvum]|uniref:Uncharacterized protein n=1 Tax=Prymnesium parvum TaxID=97485 RepID=A0AB34JJZ1_PRYPA